MKKLFVLFLLFFFYGNIFPQTNQLNEKGEKEGLWKEYYETGELLKETSWKNGKKNGLEITYYDKTGDLMSVEGYMDGTQHGIDKFFWEGGVLGQSVSYIDGKKNGVWKNFGSDGVLWSTGYYNENGKKSGWWVSHNIRNGSWGVSYYVNGKEDENLGGTYYYNVMEKPFGVGLPLGVTLGFKQGGNGVWKSYFENGNLKEEGYYSDGFKEGVWKSFSENGNLFVETTFKDGRISGLMKLYSEDGKTVIDSSYYKNGVKIKN